MIAASDRDKYILYAQSSAEYSAYTVFSPQIFIEDDILCS